LTAADFAIYMPGVTSMQVADVYKSIATSSFALDATATSYVGTNANDAFTTSALANIGTGAGSCLGGSGTDSIVFTTSGLAVADADLTGHTSIENVVLGGAGSTVLAAGALASGISSVRLGVGATALTTANTLTVDAERLAANTALTVSGAGAAGAGAVTITNLQGDIADANTHTGTMNIALVSNVLDNGVSIITGAGNVSVTGGAADDTVTIDATLLDTANTITVSAATSAALTVTALVGSVVATNLAGALTITTADDAGNAIGITTGSGNVTVTGGAAGDTITVTGLATDGQTFTGSVSKFSITAGAGAQTITTGALADIIAAGEGNDTITGGAGDDSITGGTGADSIVGGATDHIYVSAGDSGLGTITTPSITTNNMDKITVAATTILDLTGAVQTKANYDNFTEVAAGGAITTTLVTNEVGQFVGVWDSATEVFTSSATNAAATASATDEDALLYTYAVADGTNTVATQGVIVLGVGAQTDADIENGIITFASGVGATFTLTTGVDNKIGGPGDDTFVATYDSGIASDTFENGDTLNGNGGIDTVTIDQFIGDVAITAVAFEALWTNVTNMEKVVINQTGAGAQTITTGGAFNTAFNGAVDIKTSTTAGAIDISGANLVKVDATTTGAGAQTILSTGAANVTVNTTSNDGATTITTGAGNDTITLYATSAGGANSITGGAGADTIALYTNFSSVDTINIAAGDSLALAASYDMISNFTIANDILNLPSTTIAGAAPGVDGTNAGTLKSHTILNGLITFDTNDIWDGTAVNINAANVADAIAYCVANITVGTQSVMFQYDASGDGSYGVGDAVFIFQNGATDTLVELVGLDASSHTKLAAASAANTVVIA
jgi:hypothetical protein